MTVDPNLPATRTEPGDALESVPVERRQPIGVAFLPLALVTFIVLALTIAAWTFLFAAG
jgi:hypothetical protein